MAVKKRKVVATTVNQQDLMALTNYLQIMKEQPSYLPPKPELIKHCVNLVDFLANTKGDDQKLWELIESVEDCIVALVQELPDVMRNEVTVEVLSKFYGYTSGPQKEVNPVVTIMLSVLEGRNEEALTSAARWLLIHHQDDTSAERIKSTLSFLLTHMTGWNATPILAEWAMAFIKALENQEEYDILLKISFNYLKDFMQLLHSPESISKSAEKLIFLVLASVRDSVEAFEEVAPLVEPLLLHLAENSSPCNRSVLQNVVDIITAFIDNLIANMDREAVAQFQKSHRNLILHLKEHMGSDSRKSILKKTSWGHLDDKKKSSEDDHVARKVGLINLGNTCYINSVMQALLVTRKFTNYVVLNMTNRPYWCPMAELFAKMLYSVNKKVNPEEFFKVIEPSAFRRYEQHDSSEFLGYLFQVLHKFENIISADYDYENKPSPKREESPLTSSPTTCRLAESSPRHGSLSPRRRSLSPRPGSLSPRPGSSTLATGSGVKRLIDSNDDSARKRICRFPSSRESYPLPREPLVDKFFGGTLRSIVKCVDCGLISKNLEKFRDIQLGFPEKEAKRSTNVQTLLNYYCSMERMYGENRYFCPDCGDRKEAEKIVHIEKAPQYLILVLKNFNFIQSLREQVKLLLSVHCDEQIVLPTMNQQKKQFFTLYAAVIHSGSSPDSGHYYTIVREDDNKWFRYDDEEVSVSKRIELNDTKTSSTPYILFYRRNDVDEPRYPDFTDLPRCLQEHVLADNKIYIEQNLY